jgi:hypothetical protein
MPDDRSRPNLVALREARDRVIAHLSDAFAHDTIDVEEFERRLTVAHRSESMAEIEELVRDLEPSNERIDATALVLAAPMTTTLAEAPETRSIIAIFGGATRRGQWKAPRRLKVVCIFGGAELDFRGATFAPGVTEIEITAVMGGASIVVPPNLAVEMEGTAIFGGFDHNDRAPANPDPDRPMLRIRGFAMMGGVSIETRLPGESTDWEQRRERHRERKAMRHGGHPRRLPRGR